MAVAKDYLVGSFDFDAWLSDMALPWLDDKHVEASKTSLFLYVAMWWEFWLIAPQPNSALSMIELTVNQAIKVLVTDFSCKRLLDKVSNSAILLQVRS